MDESVGKIIMRPVQYFTKEYVENCSRLTPAQFLDFVENARLLYFDAIAEDKTILISLKIKESLLKTFKQKCAWEGAKYQTKIKELMLSYLKK